MTGQAGTPGSSSHAEPSGVPRHPFIHTIFCVAPGRVDANVNPSNYLLSTYEQKWDSGRESSWLQAVLGEVSICTWLCLIHTPAPLTMALRRASAAGRGRPGDLTDAK